jgi:hypothetical protein
MPCNAPNYLFEVFKTKIFISKLLNIVLIPGLKQTLKNWSSAVLIKFPLPLESLLLFLVIINDVISRKYVFFLFSAKFNPMNESMSLVKSLYKLLMLPQRMLFSTESSLMNQPLFVKKGRAQMMDIADVAIQVGGATEGQSFVLKI